MVTRSSATSSITVSSSSSNIPVSSKLIDLLYLHSSVCYSVAVLFIRSAEDLPQSE